MLQRALQSVLHSRYIKKFVTFSVNRLLRNVTEYVTAENRINTKQIKNCYNVTYFSNRPYEIEKTEGICPL